MGEVLIKAENVSKKFSKDLKLSLYYGVLDVFSGIKGSDKKRELRKDEFWAVRNISFEVRRGECLGLIGHNGAGKSTLLKMLNGLIKPDEGRITMHGKVGALIELGAGFNPILTGRENIYNNAAVIGFSKKEIDVKFDEIVAFSEIEEFLDMPVQNYSSGMKVRLGFAIAAQMEPDVLIIDEVLAVGDLGFILKCFSRIDKILPNTALIFVSHNMPMVSRICNEIILMEKGKIKFQGKDVGKGIESYYSLFHQAEQSNLVFDTGKIDFISSYAEGLESQNGIYNINWGENIVLNFKIKSKTELTKPYVSLAIYDKEQRGVAEVFPPNQNLKQLYSAGSEIEYKILINNIYLSKGLYFVTLSLNEQEGRNPLLKIHKTVILQVIHSKQVWTAFILDSKLI